MESLNSTNLCNFAKITAHNERRLKINAYLCRSDMKVDAKQQLFRKLKKENCFWSYDLSKMKSISDESLIEHVLLHLDIEDINQLFQLFGYKKAKVSQVMAHLHNLT